MWHQFALPIRSSALCQLSQIPTYKNRWFNGEFRCRLPKRMQETTKDADMDVQLNSNRTVGCEFCYLCNVMGVLKFFEKFS